jgi:hypothetical protein
MSRFRLMGIPDELRMAIEEASQGTVTTETARLIAEYSIDESSRAMEQAIQTATKEVQGVIGPHGAISRLQAGGLNITRGGGIQVYADGVEKTTIDPRGNVIVGSDIKDPRTTTEIFFVEDGIHNGEKFDAGDFLIGNNSAGSSNVKYDAGEGQLQFRTGQTVTIFLDTDGSLRVGDGTILGLDSNGISFGAGGNGGSISYTGNNIVLYNFVEGQGISLTIETTDLATPYILWRESPSVDNQTLLEIFPGAAGLRTVFGYDHYIDALPLSGTGSATVRFNERGHNIDFSIEGDTDANLFYSDASADKVGIGLNNPSYKLDVSGDINATGWLYIDGNAFPYNFDFTPYDSLPSGMTTDGLNVFVAPADRTVTLANWTQGVRVATTNNGSNYWRIRILRLSDGSTVNEINTSAISADTWASISDSSFSIATIGTSDVGIYLNISKVGTPGALSMSTPLVRGTF